MKKLAYSIVCAFPLIYMSGIARAAEGGGEAETAQPGEIMDFPLSGALINLIIFLLVVFVLGKFVWPKVLAALDAREEKIRGDIESAEAANQKAQNTLAAYERKLAETHDEARKLIEQAKVDSEKVRSRLAAETEAQIARMRERAEAEIGQAKTQAVEELYSHASKLAVAVAEKILQRNINDADTQQLVDRSLRELDSINRG